MIYSPNQLPKDLKKVIGEEPVDFAVKAKWNHSRKKVRSFVIITIIWNAFIALFLYITYAPLLTKGEVHFKSNGVSKVATLDNLKPLLVPSLILSAFLLVGIVLIVWSFISYFQKGGYFIGTPNRLIKYRNSKIETFDWEQFTGNTRVNLNGQTGSIEFLLRTGKIHSSEGNKRFVPDRIEMAGISKVLEIEEKCRKRIKENDPTPAKITK